MEQAVMSQTIAPRDRLIVALDISSVTEAEAMIARIGDSVYRARAWAGTSLAGKCCPR